MIKILKKNEVFVFGSNLAGIHAGGAARQAFEEFGAKMEVGEGITGQSYAFPTLDQNLRKRSKQDLETSRDKLYKCAHDNPDKVFLLTKIGCGIAGYSEEYMRSLLKELPANVAPYEGWTLSINP